MFSEIAGLERERGGGYEACYKTKSNSSGSYMNRNTKTQGNKCVWEGMGSIKASGHQAAGTSA